MIDPVIDQHGHSFESKAILDWLKTKSTCPMNQQPLTPEDLAPNRALKETIESYQLTSKSEYNKNNLSAMRLCRLALEAFPGHAETWKTMAAMQHKSSETLKILLKGANEPSMPLKERIELCEMVLREEPDRLQARLLILELNQLKMKHKIKRLKQEMKERLPPAAPSQVEKKDSALPASLKRELQN
jgi:hypothetical protein